MVFLFVSGSSHSRCLYQWLPLSLRLELVLCDTRKKAATVITQSHQLHLYIHLIYNYDNCSTLAKRGPLVVVLFGVCILFSPYYVGSRRRQDLFLSLSQHNIQESGRICCLTDPLVGFAYSRG